MAEQKPGYDDTPVIPGSSFRIHDKERPHPRVVAPGTASSQKKPGTPPSDAVILFDGTSLSGWQAKKGGPAGWKVENGYMEAAAKTGDIVSKKHFGDCQLHVEFACPAKVEGDCQGRGNSGVFLMGRYEIQVLDCYNNPTYADGSTASIYGEFPPLVNACRKPGEWTTYDAVWIGPRFEGKRLIRPAFLTLFHNGVLVHHNQMLLGPTSHRVLPPWTAHPAEGPLQLQDHGNPVRFRNIWFRPLTGYDEG